MADWTVTTAPVPTTTQDAAAWAVLGAHAASRATHRALWGHDDLAWRAAEVVSMLRDRPYERALLLVVTPADGPADARSVAGAALMWLPLQDNLHLAVGEVLVRPEDRGRGAGTALVEAVEAVARAEGRSTVLLTSDHRTPRDGAATVSARSGSGAVPADDVATGMAARRGYGLEQVERFSTFTLPLEGARRAAVRALHDQAADAAGAGYRVLSWTGPTPAEHVDAMAVLKNRMSTDVPKAGLSIDEEPWDAERVRAHDREVADEGRVPAVVAAQHVPTGALVAFTVVEWPVDVPGFAFQQDTLVVAAHRGHRLGMLVKATQLLRLHALRPSLRRVHTWNAQENDHMLAINVALGFTPTGATAMWQRKWPTGVS